MEKKQIRSGSLIRPIFNSIIGLILLLSAAVGAVGYYEFAGAIKQQYMEIANGIAKNVALGIDPDELDKYLTSRTPDEEYDAVRENIQHAADSEDCSVIYVAVVHTDTKEREYIYNIVSQSSGFSPYEIGSRDVVGEEFLTAYDSILKGETELHNFMYERSGYTTSIFPAKDETGKAAAIVGVVKNMILLDSVKKDYIVRIIIVEAIIAVISGVFQIVYFKRRIVDPVRKVSKAAVDMVEHLEDGKAPVITVKNNDEIGDLAESFSKMYGEVGEYIKRLEKVTSEKQRISAELNVATQIQANMLPCIFPAFPERKEFDIYATMNPANEVGGDFYDFFMVDERHLAIVVADVSGKGVPAALFMVIGKTLIKDHTTPGKDLGEVFTEVNELLCESNSEGLFITAFEGVLDLVSGEFRYVNAGHEIPYICKKDGKFEPHKIRAGFVLAGMEGMRYKCAEAKLDVGDKIFQYTDGVTEATNVANELYGMDRLTEILGENSGSTPTELLPKIKEDIDRFVGEAPQFDDITMLCLEYKARMEN